MTIRNAQPQELDALLALYAGARRFMAERGNAAQWGDGYPPRGTLAEDIRKEQLYVCEEDGRILAAFVLALGDDPTYAVIDGAWLDDEPYGTLHRIASSGERAGMVNAIVSWAYERVGNLRGDTHALNQPMQRAFERNGFARCGTIWVADGTPRIAYHKPRRKGGE